MAILNKIRTIVLGSINDLLDKQIDKNSPSAVRQYVRDLEDALGKMQTDAASAAGAVRTASREVGDIQHKIDALTTSIKNDLTANREEAARTKGTSVIQLQKSLAVAQESLKSQQETSSGMDLAVSKLEARHAEMLQQLRNLERMDRDSKAKEQATVSLRSADKVLATGADLSVDDLQDRMRRRNDIASEGFDRAMGSMHTEESPETAGAVDDLLASLRPKS